MSWDVTTPADNEVVRKGDDRIRELKADLEAAIGAEHSFPVLQSAPVAYHNFPSGSTAARPAASAETAGRFYLNTDVSTNGGYIIQRDNGTGWDDLTDISPFPASTTAFFCQATAPTGWTRSSSVDDRMLRVNSSVGGGTGGAWGITIAAENFPHGHGGATASGNFDTIAAHSGTYHYLKQLNIGAEVSAITHPSTAHAHILGSENFNHGHVIASDWKPAYNDLIMAVKD